MIWGDSMRSLRSKKNHKKKMRRLFVVGLVIIMMFIGIGVKVEKEIGIKIADAENVSTTTAKQKETKDSGEDLRFYEGKKVKTTTIAKAGDKPIAEKKEEAEAKEIKKEETTEKIDNNTKKEEDIIKNEENKSTGKVAYLTFDDGPTVNNTPQILDILDRYNVKATFFMIGYLAERSPKIVSRIYTDGHAIGNHTYSHNYKYVYSNNDNFISDINKCESTLKNILGDDFETKIVRFPGGSFGNKKESFKTILKENGYVYVDWNALNGDAEGRNIPTDRLVQRLKNTTKGKNKAIILMHDAAAKKNTVEALPQIIEYLIKEGYEFKTVNPEDI
mgnify:CR=1 FL=1